MKLAIISHTEHYKTSDGTIVGWGPTINEINHLTHLFDEVYHLAMLHPNVPPPSVLPYTSDKVKFVELPTVGGRSLGAKLHIVLKAPKILKIVSKVLNKVDYFQLRTPTGIGVFLIPYLTFFVKKKGWFKYAGNWNQERPPLGYAMQRWMLKRQSRVVTINGNWNNQPKHCLTFENPCLFLKDRELGVQVASKKQLSMNLTFCFVGRLEKEKGVERIINAFSSLNATLRSKVKAVHFVGDGPERSYFETLASKSDIKMLFHGFLSRDQVFDIYKESHVFLLPSSASEGFPKVIAEAMNFGCLPVVSNVSAIGQYVNQDNGFVLEDLTNETIMNTLMEVIALMPERYSDLLAAQSEVVSKFTFEHYNNRIKNEILDLG